MTTRKTTAARCLLGAAFLLFGLDGFFRFLPIPPARPAAQQLIGALIASGYFFPMVKLIEITAGVMLLGNRMVPLALALLAPLLVGITSIHLFLNPEGLPLMAVLLALHAYLSRGFWAYVGGVFAFRAVPR